MATVGLKGVWGLEQLDSGKPLDLLPSRASYILHSELIWVG